MKLRIESTKWHGCSYHVISPYSPSWSIEGNISTWTALQEWCENNFGIVGDPWSTTAERWYYNNGKIFLRNEKDLSLFVLRWS